MNYPTEFITLCWFLGKEFARSYLKHAFSRYKGPFRLG